MSYVTTSYTLHLGSVFLSNIGKQLLHEVTLHLNFLRIFVLYTHKINAPALSSIMPSSSVRFLLNYNHCLLLHAPLSVVIFCLRVNPHFRS